MSARLVAYVYDERRQQLASGMGLEGTGTNDINLMDIACCEATVEGVTLQLRGVPAPKRNALHEPSVV